MCVSAVVETDRERLAGRLGHIALALATGSQELDLTRRVEAHGEAWVVRLGPGGRLTAEPMIFNPYVVRRQNLGGDMWASSLVGKNHGLIVLKGFSEWVAPEPLLSYGLATVHDLNCAFNRVAGRLLLANFTPEGSLLVPVLFDSARDGGKCREFVIISDEPPEELEPVGVGHAPLSLGLEAAVEWLHPETTETQTEQPEAGADEPFAIDFTDVLAEGRVESFSFSLYKSA